jgi:glycosyltransferase involved in cell wall biosynthesis
MTQAGARRPVVLFSTADWFWPYWTNKQHIASRLAARGFRVLYVESIGLRRPGMNPTDLARIWNRLCRAVRPIGEVQTNLWVLSPLTIPAVHAPWLEHLVNVRPLQIRIKAWLRRTGGGAPIVWTYHPYMLAVSGALSPAAIVYHCVDDLSAVPGIDGPAFVQAERELLSRCDQVFTTSPVLQERCAAIAPGRTDYFGNVADIAHFGAAREDGPIPPELDAIPRPRLAYLGVLSDFKVDFALVERAAALRPDWHFVFIGDEREGQHSQALARLRSYANVHCLGWRPYSELPRYLRGIDVALLPSLINDYTRAMFPMKFFEYLAAGRPVVGTRLPALAEFATLYRQADTPQTMIEAISAAIASPRDMTLPIGHPLLQSHSWDARIDAMLDRLTDQRSHA